MKLSRSALSLFCALTTGLGTAHAAVTTIGSYTFDLGQFAGAGVTTTAPGSALNGTTFDQEFNFDGFTLGELATAYFGSDLGDFISLGNNTTQRSLTLTYGTPFAVGSGQSALFVVYEQSGRTTVDAEGTAFEISFNGGVWNSASSGVASVVGGNPAVTNNQIAFDLTTLGFSTGQLISTVSIRNKTGLGDASDPDFTFAGRAGVTSTPGVPDGGSTLVMLGAGLFCLLATARRMRA